MGGGGVSDTSVAVMSDRGEPPKRGTSELLRLYSRSPWLRAAVGRISQSLAAVPWTAYMPDGGDVANRRTIALQLKRANPKARKRLVTRYKQAGNLIELPDHPIVGFLDAGNAHHTGVVARRLTQTYLDLQGEVFWVIERTSGGLPAEYLPVPGTWVSRTPSSDSPFYEINHGSWRAKIPQDDVVWIRDPDPENPYGRGSGIAMALGDELESDEYAAKMLKAKFYNNNIPAGLFTVDGIDGDEVQRVKAKLDKEHRGFGKWGRAHVFNREVKFQQVDQNLQQSQFVEIREFERNAIIQVFGVPPEILGIVENSNRATIESADLMFSRYVLVPRLELMRDCLQARIAPWFGENVILDYENPVDEDAQYLLDVAKAAPWTRTNNEWRALQGLDPEESDFRMVPVNMAAVPVDTQPIPLPGMSTDEDDLDEILDQEFQEGLRLFVTQRTGRPRLIPAKASVVDVDNVMNKFRPEPLERELKPEYRDAVDKWGNQLFDDVGVSARFDMFNPVIVENIRDFGLNRTAKINGTTKKRLKSTLVDGVKAGEGGRELTKRVTDVMTRAKKHRAQAIARTEVLRAANFARQEAMKQSGVIPAKMWLATLDARVRDLHAALHMQQQPTNQAFNIEGHAAMYPGGFGEPEMDINCRCTMVPVVPSVRSVDGDLVERCSVESYTDERVKSIVTKFDERLLEWEERFIAAAIRAFDEQERLFIEVVLETFG